MTNGQPDREQMKKLIDEAVDCWHAIADEHDFKHCNCFRDKFVRRLIDLGLFDGYKLDEYD